MYCLTADKVGSNCSDTKTDSNNYCDSINGFSTGKCYKFSCQINCAIKRDVSGSDGHCNASTTVQVYNKTLCYAAAIDYCNANRAPCTPNKSGGTIKLEALYYKFENKDGCQCYYDDDGCWDDGHNCGRNNGG